MKRQANVKLIVQLARKYSHMLASGAHDNAGIRLLKKILTDKF